MPVKKPETVKNNWAASMTRSKEVIMEIWAGLKPGAIRRESGAAKIKMTTDKTRKARVMRFKEIVAVRQASCSSLAKSLVKTGMKAAERELIISSWKTVSGMTKAA